MSEANEGCEKTGSLLNVVASGLCSFVVFVRVIRGLFDAEEGERAVSRKGGGELVGERAEKNARLTR
jgi:hypothetical protein